jgi:hypothetical protein
VGREGFHALLYSLLARSVRVLGARKRKKRENSDCREYRQTALRRQVQVFNNHICDSYNAEVVRRVDHGNRGNLMGAAGPTILFVILLVAAIISGLYIVAYTSNVFLTIIQQTAAGIDTIAWPNEPWYDWIGKTLHLALIVACWMVPLGIVLRLIGPESLATSTALYVGVPALMFCCLFPITLLSSFSAGSPLALLRLEVIRRMTRCTGGTIVFYLLSAPLCVAGAAVVYATLAHHIFYALAVLATVLFLYGRLIGRYSRLLGRVRIKGTKPKVDREVRRAAQSAQVEDPWGSAGQESPNKAKKKKKKSAAKARDPWAVPEEPTREADPPEETAEGYGLATDGPAPAPPRKQAPPPVEGYDVRPPEQTRPKEVPLDGSPPIEEKRILSESETPLPARPLVDGVFLFPWYPNNLGTWGLLTLLFLFWGLIYRGMQGVRPF